MKISNEKILARWLSDRANQLYGVEIEAEIFEPDNPEFGDLSTNLPFKLARTVRKPPKVIGEEILEADIPKIFSRAEMAGAGYINFYFDIDYLHSVVLDVNRNPDEWGRFQIENPKNIQIEFVSANPTGPLNIVSARAAAVGSTIAKLLELAGNKVTTEFYINDAGNQIRLLGESFRCRIEQVKGKQCEMPEDGYFGEYLVDYAREYVEKSPSEPPDEWILRRILDEQREILEKFRTHFDSWFSESEFRKTGKVEQVLERLTHSGLVYEYEGAKWFSASEINADAKDFVLIKSDGEWAYGLVDIAYHANKFEERGFDIVHTILGPDHHGHKARMESAMKALGHDGKLKIIILQQVNLIEGGEKVKMSKRAGKIITMDTLIEDVGIDAARYFFLARKAESHLDFDLALARKTSDENPVYYIQYAYARIQSILRFAKSKGIDIDHIDSKSADLNLLTQPEENILCRKIIKFPSEVKEAAISIQPHIIPFYLLELAKIFHNFYTKHRVVCDDEKLTLARVSLISAVSNTIKNGLAICGIEAPNEM